MEEGLRPGSILRQGYYSIEEVLGEGDFEITYLAKDIRLGRTVAIKEFFPKDYCKRDEDARHVMLRGPHAVQLVIRLKAEYLKEAKAAAGADSPDGIRIEAVFEENNTAYCVMEAAEGTPADKIAEVDGPLPKAKALELVHGHMSARKDSYTEKKETESVPRNPSKVAAPVNVEAKEVTAPTPPMPPRQRQGLDISYDKPRSRKKWYLIGAGAVAVIAMAIVFWPEGNGSQMAKGPDPVPAPVVTPEPAAADTVTVVTGMYYESSLGPCAYTGEVNAEGKPDGKGKAEWSSGVGKSYDGMWKNGKMDGKCLYVSSEGYKFEGEFKANHYSEGKLTNPDGTYYVGTFNKDGNKWNGTEYDAQGNPTDKWINGE